MEEQNLNQAPTEQKLVISSKKKWLWLGILVAAVNPIFAGLIMGAVYLSEPELRREGKIVAAIAIVWGAILFYLVNKNLAAGPFTL
ncbi:hypothetical protein KJ590_03140 [Patescibacteria group bacterium]|nr:hypothetical protein [Patescibacteria group bacterium]MBU4142970.1 hypothetical protein [Patescibacteria group bacterium]